MKVALTPSGWQLSWQSVPGKTYRILYSSDLVNWFNFGPLAEITAVDTFTTFTDPSSTPPMIRVYRLEIVP